MSDTIKYIAADSMSDALISMQAEIASLKERLEAWRALAPELDWKVYEDGAISYMISGKHLKRLKSLNEL